MKRYALIVGILLMTFGLFAQENPASNKSQEPLEWLLDITKTGEEGEFRLKFKCKLEEGLEVVASPTIFKSPKNPYYSLKLHPHSPLGNVKFLSPPKTLSSLNRNRLGNMVYTNELEVEIDIRVLDLNKNTKVLLTFATGVAGLSPDNFDNTFHNFLIVLNEPRPTITVKGGDISQKVNSYTLHKAPK